MTDWVECPICGEDDMRYEAGVIHCINLACASNQLGGVKQRQVNELQAKVAELTRRLGERE